MKVEKLSKEVKEEMTGTRCGNCGRFFEELKETDEVFAEKFYDGEWACSKECDDEHDELGCPFENSYNYRPRKY